MSAALETLMPVLDGHNDTLLHLWLDDDRRQEFLSGGERGHIDLVRARKGGLAGGLFAVFAPAGMTIPQLRRLAREDAGGSPLPAADTAQALGETLGMVAELLRTVRRADGALTIARSADEIRAAIRAGRLALVLHLEGAESIDPQRLDTLEVLYALGLRSLGLTWSRPNAFGHGVPLRFGSTGDIGPGLTAAGRRIVAECNRLGVLVDLAHLNERGFWDVAACSRAPLVVTHTAVHALAPSSRNLSDRQLDAVGASGGVVGITFNVSDLRKDGGRDPDVPLELIVRHLTYVAERIGIDHVALGSDFDGATVPTALHDVAGLQLLIDSLRFAGYDRDSLRKLAHENWLGVFEQSWRAR